MTLRMITRADDKGGGRLSEPMRMKHMNAVPANVGGFALVYLRSAARAPIEARRFRRGRERPGLVPRFLHS